MDCKFNIKKYSKFSLAANIIFNNSIFAGCNKKDNKGNNKKGYSGKGEKNGDNNNKHTEQQSNENKNKKPDNPEGNKPPIIKDYTKEKNEFKVKLNNIDTKNNFLPDKRIKFNKSTLEDKIDKIKSGTEVDNINRTLVTLESKLTNALTSLKQDYISRLNEIINGNSKLGLGLTISLTKENINNLNFDKNISNRKTDLDALETQYFGQLELKCDALKTEYNNLKTKINKITNEKQKEVAESLCNNLKDDSFKNIKKYKEYEQLNKQITNIQNIINNDIDELKNNYINEYNKFQEIAKNLNLTIVDLKNDLLNEINSLTIDKVKDVNKKLDSINEKIKQEINNLNDKFKKEYKEITDKIEHLTNNSIEFIYSPITITINENTEKDDYKRLVDSINQLQNLFNNKLTELKDDYNKKITEINKKLEGLDLSSDKIDLNADNNILSNLTFDELTNETISVIESAINDAESNYNTKVEGLKEECTNSLKQVKTDCNDDDILKTETISNSINKIEENIKKIDNKTKKDNVDSSISDLKNKITEAKNKKAEGEKKKEEEEKKKKEDEKKKRQDIINNFKNNGYAIDGCNKISIKLVDNKFKLYFNEITLIAESESKINENDIKTADDYKKSKYTIILNFAGRHTHKITGLEIDDIIDNINDCKNNYNTSTNHCLLLLNYTYNGDKYDHFYDVNTGYLCGYYSAFSDINLKEKTSVLLYLKINNKGKINTFIEKALSKDKYGNLLEKDSEYYFKENSSVTDINDEIPTKEIEKFSDISLHFEEEEEEEEGEEEGEE